jgi:hypothetical protein
MHKATLVLASAFVAMACASGEPGAEQAEGTLLVEGAGSVSFDPGGTHYVYTRGMNLAIGKIGDERVYQLTKSPPVATKEGEAKEAEEPEADVECVPAEPGAPLDGPQGGWHGQPAWSPDGRFIAFIAPWKDGNCKDGDDADWDVWLVDVSGLDLETWVKEVTPDKDDPDKKEHYVVGPEGAGLRYYQATNAAGPENRPTWSTCRALAYSTADGVRLLDLSSQPGICEKTLMEVAAEREVRIEKLENDLAVLRKKLATLEQKVTQLETPPPAPAPAPED